MAGSDYIGYPAYAAPQRTYFPQPFIQQQPLQSGIICRPVASREEAATAQVPFDGNPYVFINLAAGEIYVKQFNYNTGNTDFTPFVRQNQIAEMPVYATTDDIAALRAEIDRLKKPARRKDLNDDE